jgi:hypothetical protein
MQLLASIDGEQVVNAVIWIAAIGLCFWLLNWLIGYIGLPEPFAKVAKVILAVAAVLFLINVLLSFTGHPLVRW